MRRIEKIPALVVTIEGHCDERGTAEYNLALGERRAVAARTYLISLGSTESVADGQLCSEFPFDPAHQKRMEPEPTRSFVITRQIRETAMQFESPRPVPLIALGWRWRMSD